MNYAQAVGIPQVKALAWEFWAHAWRGLLLGLAGIISFASLLYGAISAISDISFRGTEVGTSLHFGLLWFVIVMLGAPIMSGWGVPRRRYTLPTSSFVIVTCPMVCSMLMMFVLYAIAATTLNMLYDAGWPIWGPGMVAAFSIAWLQVILWSTSNSLGLQLVSCLASFGVLLFGVVIVASPGQPPRGWFYNGPDASHALAFGLASLVCVGLGTVGFANLRHGGGIDVSRIIDWASRLFPKIARPRRLSSPAAAQFWLEWKERGYILPACTAAMGLVVLLIAPFVAPSDSIEFVNGMSTLLLGPALLVGLFLGSRSANGDFGNFNGTRPLSDSQIANAVLASTTVGVLTSALLWAAVLALVTLILGQAIDLSSLPNAIDQSWLIRLLGIATLATGATWGFCALMTSIVLAGRKVSVVVLCTLIGVWILGGVGPVLLRSAQAQEVFDTLRVVYAWACILLPLLGITVAYVVGWKMKLISRTTLVLAVGTAAVLFASAHLSGLISGPDSVLAILWGCCLAPSTLAVAPLAVWWNRHR